MIIMRRSGSSLRRILRITAATPMPSGRRSVRISCGNICSNTIPSRISGGMRLTGPGMRLTNCGRMRWRRHGRRYAAGLPAESMRKRWRKSESLCFVCCPESVCNEESMESSERLRSVG